MVGGGAAEGAEGQLVMHGRPVGGCHCSSRMGGQASGAGGLVGMHGRHMPHGPLRRLHLHHPSTLTFMGPLQDMQLAARYNNPFMDGKLHCHLLDMCKYMHIYLQIAGCVGEQSAICMGIPWGL